MGIFLLWNVFESNGWMSGQGNEKHNIRRHSEKMRRKKLKLTSFRKWNVSVEWIFSYFSDGQFSSHFYVICENILQNRNLLTLASVRRRVGRFVLVHTDPHPRQHVYTSWMCTCPSTIDVSNLNEIGQTMTIKVCIRIVRWMNGQTTNSPLFRFWVKWSLSFVTSGSMYGVINFDLWKWRWWISRENGKSLQNFNNN